MLASGRIARLIPARPFFHSMTSATSAKSKLIFAPGEYQTPTEPTWNGSTGNSQPQRAAQFQSGALSRADLQRDPFEQFHNWYSDPRLRGYVPETCCLSTAELPSGRVSARMVYLKELDDRGFVVYSNFGTSRKASDLQTNSFAALTFWHKPTERQIRIEGTTERLKPEESQVYFNTRARGSRIGAWASQQSSVLWNDGGGEHDHASDDAGQSDGRPVLDQQVKDVEDRFKAGEEQDEQIPVPPFWGGLRLIPDMIEFWQGRDSRLHDRFRYTLIDVVESQHNGGAEQSKTRSRPDGAPEKARGRRWQIERLSP